jgi:hypothetical protein
VVTTYNYFENFLFFLHITIRIGDHEILVNVNRWELDDALEDLEDEKESQLILKRMRASDQTSH